MRSAQKAGIANDEKRRRGQRARQVFARAREEKARKGSLRGEPKRAFGQREASLGLRERVSNESARSGEVGGGGRARTVDPAEHASHLLQVAVVQEPDAGVVLVLLEGHCVVRGGVGSERTAKRLHLRSGETARHARGDARKKARARGTRAVSRPQFGTVTYRRRSWSRPGVPCGARPGARRPRACPRSHPVFGEGERRRQLDLVHVRMKGSRVTRNRCPSTSRGAVRGRRAVRARDTHLFHAAEVVHHGQQHEGVDHHLLVRRLAHRRGLRRFRHRDPLASTIERRGPSLARSVRWLPCRSRRSRDTRSARFALCPTRRASSPFSFRDGCRSDNGQNETRRIAILGRPLSLSQNRSAAPERHNAQQI